jgi:hypothetical protein
MLKIATSIALFASSIAMADIVYSTLPPPALPSEPSLGYEATQTSEFGGLIQFAGTDRSLTTVTVALDNWAYESTYETVGHSTGFDENLTLNLYNTGVGDLPGSLIATETITDLVPWRPEPDPTDCAPGSNNDYLGSDGNCYAGALSTATFDFTGVGVPDEIIFGLAYNTADYGYNPLLVAGPYNSLNFAVSTSGTSVGSQPSPDTAYWNTSTAGNYADNGAGGVGIFRQDTNWTPYSGAIEFDATTPEPGSLLLLGAGLLALGIISRRS